MPDTALVFNALTGPEMKAVILAKIDEALTKTGEFENNMTFPWVKWNFNIGLTVYPKQAADAEPGIVAKGEVVPEGPAPSGDGKVVEISSTDIVVDTPNIARIESGQPIPTPAVGAGGVVVDKPVMAPIAKEKVSGTTKPLSTDPASTSAGTSGPKR